MKWIAIAVLSLAAAVATGCEKQKFHYVATYNDTYVYDIDSADGTFAELETLTPARVKSGLDIPTEARIEDVQIEDLAVAVHIEPDNVASLVKLSGTVWDLQQHFETWNDFPVVLSGVDVPFAGLNALLEAGVSRLRSKIRGFIAGLDTNACRIELSGASVPAGRRVHATVSLRVRGTIKYTQCVSVPREVFNGEACDD